MTKNRTYSSYTREAAILLGKQIRLGRKQRKWTEHELAERAGISRATLQKIEKGDLSVAIGLAFEAAACRGTPAIGSGVLERQSDFYFLGQGLHAIRQLLATARRRRVTSAKILNVAVAYNIVAVAVALAGLMNPILAAVLMPISSVVTLGIAATARR